MTRKSALKKDNQLEQVYMYDNITTGKYYKLVVDGDEIRCYSSEQVLSKDIELVGIWIKAQILYEVKENAF